MLFDLYLFCGVGLAMVPVVEMLRDKLCLKVLAC